MSLNILNLITQGEWVSSADFGVGAKEPFQGLVHVASIAPRRRPGANEGAANKKLIELAPDHALFALAVTMGVAVAQVESAKSWVSVGPANSIRRSFPCVLDAAGCPALTPELRAALRAACGLDAQPIAPLSEVRNG